MRNVIDVNVAANEVELVSNIYDGDACESCINFIVDHDISVTLTKDGVDQVRDVAAVDGIACYILDDYLLRCAGEFTVSTAGIVPIRFVVEKDISAAVNISIRWKDNAFRVYCAEPGGGKDGTFGMFSFSVNNDGHLICTYDTTEPPPLSINAAGHLVWTIDDNNVVDLGRVVGGGTADGGFSPTIEATETDEGVVLTITDVNGTRTATIRHGEKGDPGGLAFLNFEVDISTGQLVARTSEKYEDISFRINENGFLEVIF